MAKAEAPKSTSTTYSVGASQSGDQVTLTISRVSTGATAFSTIVPLQQPAWGFSPDGNRFFYTYLTGSGAVTVQNVFLVDLTAASPHSVQLSSAAVGSSATVFSPGGRFFLFAYMQSANLLSMNVYDATSGALVYQTAFTFAPPPGWGSDSLDAAGWGFSPDDETLVYAYNQGSTTHWALVNLFERREVMSTNISEPTASWRFSKCGDAIALNRIANGWLTAPLFATKTGLPMGEYDGQATATMTNASTATEHILTLASGASTNTRRLAANTAGTPCAGAVHLTSLSLAPTSVQGGATATGTVTLSAAAPAGGALVTLSASNANATVPPAVRVTAGARTVTFNVLTHAVTAPSTVLITASYAGTQQSGQLQVTAATPPQPRAVASLSLSQASVVGGNDVNATVVVTGASGNTTVTLGSNAPGVATAPASIMIPSGTTSGTFTVATSPVTTSTPVTLTASAGGVTSSADLAVTPPAAAQARAIVDDPGCRVYNLAANDDGSTGPVTLPSPVNFFGTTYTYLFINNNGNVTFNNSMSTYTPFTITASTPPIIAPFFADVDTRAAGSSLVTYSYGPVTFAGRPAMCINWVNVGYYSYHADKLNSFQLMLVDRSDVNPGDFDMVMNYDRIQWETGDASGGVNGFGGTSAGAGYSAGTGNPAQYYQFPGSLVNGALLDTNATTGLTRTSRNSLTLGRHIFEVRNGAAPTGGSVAGQVFDGATPAHALPGAPVQVCRHSDGHCAFVTMTAADGRYDATGIPAGDYTVSALPPAGSSLSRSTVGPVRVVAGATTQVDVVLSGPVPPPSSVTLTPSSPGSGGIPVIYWGDPIALSANACAGGSATYSIGVGGLQIAGGAMAEAPAGTYTAIVPPVRPAHGLADVHVAVACPSGAPQSYDFNVYIDPSGVVRTLGGVPIAGAVVTLLRSDSASGPFEVVPEGSAVMSPMNRHNPDTTDVIGHFGWDVMAGYYRVRAQADNCLSATGGPYAESGALGIPPEIRDLDLRLDCPVVLSDTTPPTTTAAPSSSPDASGFYSDTVLVNLAAVDDPLGSGVLSVHYALSGAENGSGMVSGTDTTVEISTEGDTTLKYWATDVAGNSEAPHALVVRIQRGGPPSLLSLTPSHGPASGGTTVTLAGRGFIAGSTVTFGATAATGVTYVDRSTIQAVTPRGKGVVDVTITTPAGLRSTLAQAFTFDAPPAISSLGPLSGPSLGGTVITIAGKNFVPGAEVRFGGVLATNIVVSDAQTITATTPPHAPGAVTVSVQCPDGQKDSYLGYKFESSPTPQATAISPSSGPTGGGTSVTVTGAGFAPGATVTVGGSPASVVANSGTSLAFSTPAHAAGEVDVKITNPDAQTTTLWCGFTYVPPPAITRLSASTGSLLGGNTLNVYGSGFQDGAVVTFDGVPAGIAQGSTKAVLNVIAPPHALGAVRVVVTNPDGQSAEMSGGYTYVPAKPTGLAATGGLQQVSLSWTPAAGADGYEVLRSASPTGTFAVVGSTAATAFVDGGLADGSTWYYAIRATSTAGASAQSAAVKIATVPPAPTGLAATANTGQVVLSWNAAPAATSYIVLRSRSPGGPYTVVARPSANTYTDTGLAPVSTYYYVVEGKNAAGTSSYSAEVAAGPGIASP